MGGTHIYTAPKTHTDACTHVTHTLTHQTWHITQTHITHTHMHSIWMHTTYHTYTMPMHTCMPHVHTYAIQHKHVYTHITYIPHISPPHIYTHTKCIQMSFIPPTHYSSASYTYMPVSCRHTCMDTNHMTVHTAAQHMHIHTSVSMELSVLESLK